MAFAVFHRRTAAVLGLALLVTTTFLGAMASRGPVRPLTHDWRFDEIEGITLDEAVNSMSRKSWKQAIPGSATDGLGHFIIRRPLGGGTSSYVNIPNRSSFTDRRWLLVRFSGWNIRGSQPGETLRFGFTHTDKEFRPQVTAQFFLRRLSGGRIEIGGDAFGDGAERIPPETLFPAAFPQEITVVLSVDDWYHRYAIYYRVGDGDYETLGIAPFSPDRKTRFLRLYAAGDLSDAGERVSIDRIAIAIEDPVEEFRRLKEELSGR